MSSREREKEGEKGRGTLREKEVEGKKKWKGKLISSNEHTISGEQKKKKKNHPRKNEKPRP